MMGLGKPQLPAKYEVANFSRCRNIKGESQILVSLGWEFMMAGAFSIHCNGVIVDFGRLASIALQYSSLVNTNSETKSGGNVYS